MYEVLQKHLWPYNMHSKLQFAIILSCYFFFRCTSLRYLSLCHLELLTEASMDFISHIKTLHSLDVTGCNVQDGASGFSTPTLKCKKKTLYSSKVFNCLVIVINHSADSWRKSETSGSFKWKSFDTWPPLWLYCARYTSEFASVSVLVQT